jgi:hypothetical protein
MAFPSVFVWLCDCNLVQFSSLVRFVVQFLLYHSSGLPVWMTRIYVLPPYSEYTCVGLHHLASCKLQETRGRQVAFNKARDLGFSKAVFRTLGHFHHLRRMSPPASRSAILRLLNASRHTTCPCHGCSTPRPATGSLQAVMNLRKYAAPVEASKEYAFEVYPCSQNADKWSRDSRFLLRTCASAMGRPERLGWTLGIWVRRRYVVFQGWMRTPTE